MSADVEPFPQPGTPQALDHGSASVMATWLITGGAGGLGILFARWLLAQGMRSVSLADVHAASLHQDLVGEAVHALISASIADVATSSGALGAVENSANALRPLGGVVHAAGVLRVRRSELRPPQAHRPPVDAVHVDLLLNLQFIEFAGPICSYTSSYTRACAHSRLSACTMFGRSLRECMRLHCGNV